MDNGNCLNCKITVKSEGNGWREEVKSDGFITFYKDGFSAVYEIDGDRAEFKYSDGKCRQKRSGDQNIFIEFKEGAHTTLEISSSGLSGKYEIYTERLKYLIGKGGVKVSLNYISGEEERIYLTFCAVLTDRRK